MPANTHDRKESTRKFRILFRYLSGAFLVALVVFVAAGCICKKPGTNEDVDEYVPPIELPEPYVLAFADRGTNVIKVRYSEDGLTWGDGDFPTYQTILGVGAANSDRGVLNLILWIDTYSRVRAHWGLYSIWEPEPINTCPNETASSAPAAAYAGESIYLVAYCTAWDRVTVQALDTETKSWLGTSLAPASNLNSSVDSRPGIAVCGDKVALGWFRDGSLILAVGNIMIVEVESDNVPIINWTDVYTFDETEAGYGGYQSGSFALTQDGSKFYLGVTRRQSGGPLQHEGYFIYDSDDGISWELSNTMPGVPFPPSRLGLAARSDGSLLAVVIGLREPSPPHRVIMKYADGSWTTVVDNSSTSADEVFGCVPGGYREFGLITSTP